MQAPSSAARPVQSRNYPWYDSVWLSAYQRARAIIRDVAPHRAREFEGAFEIFHTRPDFRAVLINQVFAADEMNEIRRVAAALAPEQLELHEARTFRRFIVHNHAVFNALHERVVQLVSDVAGEPVEASYNFLSLYGPLGVCPLHLDAPIAKWTLDLCIDQSDPWPIYFGPVMPWPEPRDYGPDWEDSIKQSVGERFTSHTLAPGQAILFSGSSQWHYRDVMPGTGVKKFSDLLFFHFIPCGSSELVEPANWARLFGIPELEYEGGLMLERLG